MAKPAPPKKKNQVVQAAKSLGIQQPERFRPDELESLLGSLPTGSPEDIIFSPSSGALAREQPPGPPSDDELKEELLAMKEELDPSQGLAFFHEPAPELPALLGVDAVWLLSVDPQVLFVTWDASPETHARAGTTEDSQPMLRLVSPDAAGQIDVEIDLRARGWYLQPPGDRLRLQVHLGLGKGARFKVVSRSKVSTVPPAVPLPGKPTYKVTVPFDMDRRLIPREASLAWKQGESMRGAPPMDLTRTPSAAEVVQRIRQAALDAPEGVPTVATPGAEPEEQGEFHQEYALLEEFDVERDLPNSAEFVRRRLRLVAQPRPRLRRGGKGLPEGMPLTSAEGLPSSLPSSHRGPSSQDSRRRS